MNVKLTCQLCKRDFDHLGSHIWHGHKMTAKAYKQKFELPYNMGLISETVYAKKKAKFEERREFYVNNLIESGSKYRFKKGSTGQRRISQLERKRFIARMKNVNATKKLETCPVCNMKYNHLDSHLYGKHRLLRVKESDK